MNFIKFYADFRPIAREKFVYKVQMWCRIRDDINYLGPGVKPRDDKKGELCSTGPGPQDDMFLSSFYFVVVFRKKKSVSSRCLTPGPR